MSAQAPNRTALLVPLSGPQIVLLRELADEAGISVQEALAAIVENALLPEGSA